MGNIAWDNDIQDCVSAESSEAKEKGKYECYFCRELGG